MAGLVAVEPATVTRPSRISWAAWSRLRARPAGPARRRAADDAASVRCRRARRYGVAGASRGVADVGRSRGVSRISANRDCRSAEHLELHRQVEAVELVERRQRRRPRAGHRPPGRRRVAWSVTPVSLLGSLSAARPRGTAPAADVLGHSGGSPVWHGPQSLRTPQRVDALADVELGAPGRASCGGEVVVPLPGRDRDGRAARPLGRRHGELTSSSSVVDRDRPAVELDGRSLRSGGMRCSAAHPGSRRRTTAGWTRLRPAQSRARRSPPS